MKRLTLAALGVLAFFLTHSAVEAATIQVSSIAPNGTIGQWAATDIRAGGTASIVDLSGVGGNLENNNPLPTGAARLTTGFANGDKAEIGIASNFGVAGNIASSLNVGYSYYKEAVAGGNASAAPSLKLTFDLPGYSGDGYITFVYEPTYNQSSNPGTSTAVPTGDWATVSIDWDNGLFWQTGGFGQANQAGGGPVRTLADWSNILDTAFLDSTLVGISVGVGTYNQGQDGYFDNVSISHNGGLDVTYDFELQAAQVPEPASLAVWGVVGVAGLVRYRRRRRNA